MWDPTMVSPKKTGVNAAVPENLDLLLVEHPHLLLRVPEGLLLVDPQVEGPRPVRNLGNLDRPHAVECAQQPALDAVKRRLVVEAELGLRLAPGRVPASRRRLLAHVGKRVVDGESVDAGREFAEGDAEVPLDDAGPRFAMGRCSDSMKAVSRRYWSAFELRSL